MRRSSIAVGVAMLVVLVSGALVLVDRGSKGREDQPVRFGVLAKKSIGLLPAGNEACQSPVDIDRAVSQVGLAVDTAGRPGPALEVSVRDLRTRRVLQRARVPGGYEIALGGFVTAPLEAAVTPERSVAVCARNLGRRSLSLVGDNTVDYSVALDGRRELDGDWGVFFPLAESGRRTYLEMASDMVRRATVLRPGIVTPVFYGVMALLLVVAAPLLLWRAIVAAGDTDDRLATTPGPRPEPPTVDDDARAATAGTDGPSRSDAPRDDGTGGPVPDPR
ncbi:hypothetical protein [Patulibacter sp.]|uniref:hypothetical protein n=1 Tax=Patulibacter sp. TaxID=1912859 RepID=UPI00271BD562|nr:hypothetical protein [Patulibacter sp.]MDO9408791.1 hypothetical protein [Patulibacter sp.]